MGFFFDFFSFGRAWCHSRNPTVINATVRVVPYIDGLPEYMGMMNEDLPVTEKKTYILVTYFLCKILTMKYSIYEHHPKI